MRSSRRMIDLPCFQWLPADAGPSLDSESLVTLPHWKPPFPLKPLRTLLAEMAKFRLARASKHGAASGEPRSEPSTGASAFNRSATACVTSSIRTSRFSAFDTNLP